MAVKKKTTKRTKKSSVKHAEMKSFHVAKDTIPFTTFKVTRQTFYWSILLAVIILLQMWILSLQMDIATLTETIQSQQ